MNGLSPDVKMRHERFAPDSVYGRCVGVFVHGRYLIAYVVLDNPLSRAHTTPIAPAPAEAEWRQMMAQGIRGFTVHETHPGAYHVTCWNEDHTSCGVATYYDPGCSPWPDSMLLTENVAALEAQGRVNMTGKRWDYRASEWVQA